MLYLKSVNMKCIFQCSLFLCFFKDRHQWWRREFRCWLSLSIDKLFPMAIKKVIYHWIAID